PLPAVPIGIVAPLLALAADQHSAAIEIVLLPEPRLERIGFELPDDAPFEIADRPARQRVPYVDRPDPLVVRVVNHASLVGERALDSRQHVQRIVLVDAAAVVRRADVSGGVGVYAHTP